MENIKVSNSIEGESKNNHNTKKNILNWVLLVALSIAWGSADILGKKGLLIYTPNEVGIIRTFVASLVFTPLGLMRIGKVKIKELSKFFFMGLVGSVLPAFIFARSQGKLDSWLGTVLNSLTPIMTIVLARFFLKRHIFRNELIGMVIGLSGTILLISGVMGSAQSNNIKYMIFPILGALCYATSTIFISKYLVNSNIFTATAISLLPYTLIMGIMLFTKTDILYKLENIEGSYKALLFVVSLCLCSSVFAFLVFNILTRTTSSVFASIATLIAPIVSLFWGILDGENLNLTHYLGIATILFGVYILNKKQSEAPIGS